LSTGGVELGQVLDLEEPSFPSWRGCRSSPASGLADRGTLRAADGRAVMFLGSPLYFSTRVLDVSFQALTARKLNLASYR